MTIGIRSNSIVSLKKRKITIRFISIVFFFFCYLCFTGISGNLAETPILKDIFIFLANNWSFVSIVSLQKCQFWEKISGNLAETPILKDIFIFLWQLDILCQLFRYVCFTGISENLAETPILKDIFIFLANGHCFQKL